MYADMDALADATRSEIDSIIKQKKYLNATGCVMFMDITSIDYNEYAALSDVYVDCCLNMQDDTEECE